MFSYVTRLYSAYYMHLPLYMLTKNECMFLQSFVALLATVVVYISYSYVPGCAQSLVKAVQTVI